MKRRFLRLSTATSTVLFTVALVLLSVSTTGTIIIVGAARATRVHIDERTVKMLERASREVELFMNTSLTQLNTLHEQLEFVRNPYLSEAFLQNTVLTQEQFSGFRLFDGMGKVLASTAFIDQSPEMDFSRIDFYDLPAASAYTDSSSYTDVLFTHEGTPYILLKSVRADETILVGSLNIRYLWDLVDDLSVGKSGRVSIRSTTGRVIAHPDRVSVFSSALLPGSRTMDAGEEEVVLDTISDGNQVSLMRAYRRLSPIPWNIIFLQPTEEAYLPVRAITWNSIISAFATALVAGVLGLVFSLRLTRPLRKLTVAIEGFDLEGSGQRISAGGSSETEKLGSAFNALLGRLQTRTARLAESEFELRAIMNNVSDLMFALDAEGKVQFANDRFSAITGYTCDEYLGRRFADLFDPEGRSEFESRVRSLTRTDPVVSETFLLTLIPREGRPRVVELSIVHGANSEHSVLGTVRDVTERQRLQQQLIRSDKLATLGEIISSVAHELNNPLTSIIGYSSLLAESPELTEKQIESAQIVQQEAMRTARIVRNLLGVARTREPERSLCDLNAIVDDVINLRAYQLSVSQITLVKSFGDLPEVFIDRHQIHQVVLNLVNNAVDVLTDREFQRRLVLKTFHDESSCYLSVSDNGSGIDPALSGQIFEPFFTTKPEGSGTGLGLSISSRIVSEHGGTLELKTSSGEGTEFVLGLPKASRESIYDDAPEIPATFSPMRVLVVDDEEQICRFISAKLTSMGCDVTVCESGSDAKRALDRHFYDEVLCDLRMPGVDGWQLFLFLRETLPAQAKRVLFMTGDTLNEAVREKIEKYEVGLLAKPFSVVDLVALLARRQQSRGSE